MPQGFAEAIPWGFALGFTFCAHFVHAKLTGITEGELEKRGKYWHWRYRVDGVQKSRSLKVTQLAEAKRLRQAYIGEYHENAERFIQTEKTPTIEQFWDQFEPSSSDHKSRNTKEAELQAWRKLTKFTGANRIGDLTPARVEKFKATMKKPVQGRKALSDASINHTLRHLKAI